MIIPETVEIGGVQYSVTGIEEYAFYVNHDITSVNIPATVVSIGNSAFEYTENLTSITIADGNPVFDSREGCNAIIETATNTLIAGCQNTIIPTTVTTIGEDAFRHQKYLTSIDIPNSVTVIKEYAFSYTGLVHVTIPESIKKIDNYTFNYCSKLASIDLGHGVDTICRSAFGYCLALTDLSIPSSVSTIDNWAFLGCTNLGTITVEQGNTVYDSRNNCNAIIEKSTTTLVLGCKNTVIPNTVTIIGPSAFYGCSGLKAITIPTSVELISQSAFESCTSLTSIVIPGSVTKIKNYAFEYCRSLANVTLGQGLQEIGTSAFAQCDSLVEIEFPNAVKSIAVHAFYRCKSLQRIVIPASVTSIDNTAFYACENLKSIVVDSNNPVYDSREGCNALILTSNNTVIMGCRTTVIPPDVLFIAPDAFSYAKGLTSIKIPNSVKSIGNCAFEYCYNLAEVEIGSGVAWIGYSAFRRCDALRQVISHAVTPPIIQKDDTFDCFENYETAVLHVPQESLSAYQADDEWGKFAHTTCFIGGGTGDLNGDGALDVDDVIGLIGMLLDGGQLPAYADLNGDGVPDIDDVTLLISMLLNGH